MSPSAWGSGNAGSSRAVKAPPAPTSSLAAAAAAAAGPKASAASAARGGTKKGSSSSGGSGTSNSGSGRGGRGNPPHTATGGGRDDRGGGGGGGKKRPAQPKAPGAPSPPPKPGAPKAATTSTGSKQRQRASHRSLEEVELLQDSSDAVRRLPLSRLLSCRLQYLAAPAPGPDGSGWSPHKFGHWVAEDREERIRREMDRLWNVAPLQVNHATRWAPKHARPPRGPGPAAGAPADGEADGVAAPLSEVEEEQLRQAFAILNKLSWTTLDRLSKAFLKALGVPDGPAPTAKASAGAAVVAEANVSLQVVRRVMELLLDKAMLEPHFCELYARFAERLARAHRVFRKTLVAQCRQMFYRDDDPRAGGGGGEGSSSGTAAAGQTSESTDGNARDKELEETLTRKKTIGLMHFIGELYHVDLISGDVMITCLQRLMQPDDEERLDCFCKLMTTIGSRLHDDKSEQDEAMQAVWRKVYAMAGREVPAELKGKEMDEAVPKAPSVRVRFLLQDLIELKDNNWVHRRKQEKAKSIKEIHKEVAREEAAAQRRQSTGATVRKSTPAPRPPAPAVTPDPVTPDEDGFVSVPKSKRNSHRRSPADAKETRQAGPKTSLQAAISDTGTGKAKKNKETPQRSADASPAMTSGPSLGASSPPPTEPVLDAEECARRGRSLLKDFLVSGDVDDAVLTVEEVVRIGTEGHAMRGTSLVEAALMMALEMKQTDVDKFLVVLEQSLQEQKINAESLIGGLQMPLECLRDIEIDAPMAAKLLATIVASWIRVEAISLDVLQSSPDIFLEDGRPAEFACMVLARKGGAASDAEIAVVEQLLEHGETVHKPIREWIGSFQ